MITIAYRFRVYADQKQLETLKQFAQCVRFVYNYMLALAKERYEKESIKWNTFEYKKLLPKLKVVKSHYSKDRKTFQSEKAQTDRWHC